MDLGGGYGEAGGAGEIDIDQGEEPRDGDGDGDGNGNGPGTAVLVEEDHRGHVFEGPRLLPRITMVSQYMAARCFFAVVSLSLFLCRWECRDTR
jgi:hypothetical protein